MTTEFTFAQPIIDFLILADRAEALNGKLYMMGGGWDRLAIGDFSHPIPISLAVGVLVPWNATNEEHHLQIRFETEDGTPLEQQPLEIGVNVGRPPGSIRGQSFRALIAVNGALTLPGPGTYRVVARFPGADAKTTVFHVVAPQHSVVPNP